MHPFPPFMHRLSRRFAPVRAQAVHWQPLGMAGKSLKKRMFSGMAAAPPFPLCWDGSQPPISQSRFCIAVFPPLFHRRKTCVLPPVPTIVCDALEAALPRLCRFGNGLRGKRTAA
jgi:hypothetical protein